MSIIIKTYRVYPEGCDPINVDVADADNTIRVQQASDYIYFTADEAEQVGKALVSVAKQLKEAGVA